jgi:transaldolase/glucose-6-phosphate isomerase
VFLEITAAPARNLPIPGRRLSFAEVETAQALGDLAVLTERGRRILRVDLGEDAEAGLARLTRAAISALA